MNNTFKINYKNHPNIPDSINCGWLYRLSNDYTIGYATYIMHYIQIHKNRVVVIPFYLFIEFGQRTKIVNKLNELLKNVSIQNPAIPMSFFIKFITDKDIVHNLSEDILTRKIINKKKGIEYLPKYLPKNNLELSKGFARSSVRIDTTLSKEEDYGFNIYEECEKYIETCLREGLPFSDEKPDYLTKPALYEEFSIEKDSSSEKLVIKDTGTLLKIEQQS